MKYCPECGKAGVEGMKFCPRCGQGLIGFDLEEKQEYVHQPEVRPKAGKMRKAAGIILVITGILSVGVPTHIADMIARTRAESWDEFLELSWSLATSTPVVLAPMVLLGLIVGGGICALRKQAWGWAVAAAVCSMIAMSFFSVSLGIPGLLATIFLVKRKGEFQKMTPGEYKSAGNESRSRDHRMKKVVIGIVVVVAIAIVVCLVPVKEITYTVGEPLNYEAYGYTQTERRDDWQLIQSAVAWSKNPEEVVEALKESYQSRPTAYVKVQNKDKTSGVFEVQIIFATDEKQYVKNYSLRLHSGELRTLRYQALDIEGGNWSFDYEVTADTKMVTRYKKVTLVDYWLHH